MALDAPALAWAMHEGLPHTGIDAWLNPGDLTLARKLAAEFEVSWFAPCKDLFTFDSLCLPEFDREALYAYWHSSCLAHMLSQGLARRGIRRLTVFHRDPPWPMLYFEPADTTALYLKGAFPGQVECVVQGGPESLSAADAPPGKPEFFLHDNTDLLRDRAVICLNPLEVFRLSRHIGEIRSVFGHKVVLVINSHLAQDVNSVARETGLPVLGLGPAGKPSVDVGGQCLRGFAGLLEAHAEPLRGMLRHNVQHFEALFRRWVWLQATREYWQRALACGRPALVVTSSLEDAESQLPAVAATSVGIKSLCIPHGIGYTRITRPKAGLVLYQGMADRETFLRSGLPAERLAACCDLAIGNEYPVDNALAWTPAQGRCNILALIGPAGRHGGLYSIVRQDAQLLALRTLACPPPDLAHRLAVTLKPHPGLPDLELVQVAGPEATALLAPLDLPLASALAAADLVVALNYTGVAILHCAEAGKPLVQLWLDEDIGRVGPMQFADLYAPAGDMVRTVDRFWDALRRFLQEPGYASSLRLRARDFTRSFHAGERRCLSAIVAAAAGRDT